MGRFWDMQEKIPEYYGQASIDRFDTALLEGTLMNRMNPTPNLRAVVYGAAVGDALGVPYEFRSRDTFECVDMVGHGSHDMPAGTFSDDTSMLLATCDSIRAKHGGIDCDDMRKRFGDWLYRSRYTPDGVVFDVGNTVSTALAEGEGCGGERSNGNGSLMRIIPLAFTYATDEDIENVSAITHAHALSKRSCVAFVRIARDLMAGKKVEDAIRDVFADEADPLLANLSDIYAWKREDVESSGYVLHTLGASLWCLANAKSYAECVLVAVNLGSDTDTTACVAGALAGIVYGMEGIPKEWLETLRGKDVIERCLFSPL